MSCPQLTALLGRGEVRPPRLRAFVHRTHSPTCLSADSCSRILEREPSASQRPNNSTSRPMMAKDVKRTATSQARAEGEGDANDEGTRPGEVVVPDEVRFVGKLTNGDGANGPPWDLSNAPSASEKVNLKLAKKDDSTSRVACDCNPVIL